MSGRGMICALLCLIAGAREMSCQVPYGNNPRAGHFVEIDGARIYYERYGSGRPVVLLHGGLFGYIDEFAALIEALSPNRTVIAIALRGHGKSALGSGMSHQRFADDAAEIIRRELREPADVVGFSSGAMAAYRLAIRHPNLVRRLVAIGGPIARSGWTDVAIAEAKDYETPEKIERQYPQLVAKRKQLYADPTDWDKLVKAFAVMNQEPDIPESALRSLAQPTLIMAGDRDEYTRTEHFLRITQLLPRGSLAILPQCGHVVLACARGATTEMIREYLGRDRL